MFPALVRHSQNPGTFLIWAAIGLVAGIYLFVRGFQLLRRRRLILDTPMSKIRSAAMGMVEISGLAVGPYTMPAPITGRPCYYYRTEVWEWKRRGKNSEWVKIAGECMHLPFFVDDNTGRMLVDPRGADLDLHRDFRQEFNGSFFSHDDAPATVSDFLARHGVATSNRIKVEESCIKPKNALFILGTLGENPGVTVSDQPISESVQLGSQHSISINLGTGSLSLGRDSNDSSVLQRVLSPMSAPGRSTVQVQVIRLSQNTPVKPGEMTQQQKVAAALMKAGITNPAAWAASGAMDTSVKVSPAIAGPVSAWPAPGNGSTGTSGESANGFDLHPPVVLTKGTNDKTFLISWRSQREVAASLGWKCTLMIWGGAALSLISLYILLGLWQLL